MKEIELSIIFSIPSESPELEGVLGRYCEECEAKGLDYELIVSVCVGSDSDEERISRLSERHNRIRVIRFPSRLGMGILRLEGLKSARGRLAAFSDPDGSVPPEELIRLSEEIGEADGIIGSRWLEGSNAPGPQPAFRPLTSRLFNWYTRIALGLPFRDTQCGAKVFRRESIEPIINDIITTDHGFDACLLRRALKAGLKVREEPVSWLGERLPRVGWLRYIPEMLTAVMAIRLNEITERSRRCTGSIRILPEEMSVLEESEPLVGILIPCRELSSEVMECVRYCSRMDYVNKEIILLPDEECEAPDYPEVRIQPTGPVKPAVKRNMGAEKLPVSCRLIAFIDSDAFPREDWLSNAVRYFSRKNVGGLGGPNLTPGSDTARQAIGGQILGSLVGTGGFSLRYRLRLKFRQGQPVKEMPSCNLLVRREAFEKVGGFDESILTGEDAKLCFSIRRSGQRILYAPDVIVYHHRRPLFLPHLEQIRRYGRDKAWVIKEDFSTDKLCYSLPFLFLVGLVTGAISSLLWPPFRYLYLPGMFLYFAVLTAAGLIEGAYRLPTFVLGAFLTHLSHGYGFLIGLLRESPMKGASMRTAGLNVEQECTHESETSMNTETGRYEGEKAA